MRVDYNRLYNYNWISTELVKDISDTGKKFIAITGTSCVGKSSFTRRVKEKLERDYTVQVIGVDSYLKEQYRGGFKFWTGTDTNEFLTPVHFDWKKLREDVQALFDGKSIEKQYYVRGIGWDNVKTLEPADIVIVEGLFLDSVQAAEYMEYDMVVKLEAVDNMIRKLRMDRDDYYRKNYENFKRTKNETLRETESTLRAGKAYQVCKNKWFYVRLFVEMGFKAKIRIYKVR